MTSATNANAAEFVARFEDAWKARLTRFVELFAEDGTLFQAGMERPISRVDIPAHQERTVALVQNMALTVHRWAARDDYVFIEWTTAGSFSESPSSGPAQAASPFAKASSPRRSPTSTPHPCAPSSTQPSQPATSPRPPSPQPALPNPSDLHRAARSQPRTGGPLLSSRPKRRDLSQRYLRALKPDRDTVPRPPRHDRRTSYLAPCPPALLPPTSYLLPSTPTLFMRPATCRPSRASLYLSTSRRKGRNA